MIVFVNCDLNSFDAFSVALLIMAQARRL